MKVWITKYALTRGIFEEGGFETEGGSLRVPYKDGYGHRLFHGEDREWSRSLEAARKRAEEMRAAKIQSLRKQIAKLEKMEF